MCLVFSWTYQWSRWKANLWLWQAQHWTQFKREKAQHTSDLQSGSATAPTGRQIKLRDEALFIKDDRTTTLAENCRVGQKRHVGLKQSLIYGLGFGSLEKDGWSLVSMQNAHRNYYKRAGRQQNKIIWVLTSVICDSWQYIVSNSYSWVRFEITMLMIWSPISDLGPELPLPV